MLLAACLGLTQQLDWSLSATGSTHLVFLEVLSNARHKFLIFNEEGVWKSLII